eukprot:5014406-Prymnesium_polylepis.1
MTDLGGSSKRPSEEPDGTLKRLRQALLPGAQPPQPPQPPKPAPNPFSFMQAPSQWKYIDQDVEYVP